MTKSTNLRGLVELGAHTVKITEGPCVAIRVDRFHAKGAEHQGRWELYLIEDDYLEMFTGFAEPWQAQLLNRIVNRPPP